jgi:hypothetical protein
MAISAHRRAADDGFLPETLRAAVSVSGVSTVGAMPLALAWSAG